MESTHDEAFDNPLKQARLEKGLSLRKLAALADVDQSTISGIENGRKKAQMITLAKLAKALELPVRTFLPLLETGASERGRKGNEVMQKVRRGELPKKEHRDQEEQQHQANKSSNVYDDYCATPADEHREDFALV